MANIQRAKEFYNQIPFSELNNAIDHMIEAGFAVDSNSADTLIKNIEVSLFKDSMGMPLKTFDYIDKTFRKEWGDI